MQESQQETPGAPERAADARRPDTVPELPSHLVLYDGVCALCNGTVRLLLRLDRRSDLLFAPLQGETALALRQGLPAIPLDDATVVFVEGTAVHLRSRALFAIARMLPYPFRLLSWLRILPAWLTDLPYRAVARTRYRVFGKLGACPVPPQEHRHKLLP